MTSVSMGWNVQLGKLAIIARSIIGGVTSFEFLMALFLFAGVFKATPLISWLPVDLTAMALVASTLAGVRELARCGWSLSSSIVIGCTLMLAFTMWGLISLGWSLGQSNAYEKALHLSILCSWSYFGSALIANMGEKAVHRFQKMIVVLALIMASAVIELFGGGDVISSEDWGNSYISFGRLFGLGCVVLFGRLLWGQQRGAAIAVSLIGLLILLFGLLLGGARGPLLSTAFCILLALALSVRVGKSGLMMSRRVLVMVAGVICLSGVVLTVGRFGVFLRSIQRLVILFTEGDAHSAGRRFWYANESLDHWMSAPLLGHGIGSWAQLIGWGDVRAYPHNIFLEIAVELGFVGLILFLILWYRTVINVSAAALKADQTLAISCLLLVATFVNSLISGDLPDNRALFAMMGLVVGYRSCGASSRG